MRVLRDAKGKASKDSNLAAAEESSPASPRSHVTKLAACRVLTTLIESMFWHEASLVANNIARESGSSARHAASRNFCRSFARPSPGPTASSQNGCSTNRIMSSRKSVASTNVAMDGSTSWPNGWYS